MASKAMKYGQPSKLGLKSKKKNGIINQFKNKREKFLECRKLKESKDIFDKEPCPC